MLGRHYAVRQFLLQLNCLYAKWMAKITKFIFVINVRPNSIKSAQSKQILYCWMYKKKRERSQQNKLHEIWTVFGNTCTSFMVSTHFSVCTCARFRKKQNTHTHQTAIAEKKISAWLIAQLSFHFMYSRL